MTTTGSTGQTIMHPAVAEQRQQRASLARVLAQLGLEEGETQSQRQARNAMKGHRR